jgi:hypothetical protein
MAFTILYDEPQEAVWFKNLAHELKDAEEVPISDAKSWTHLAGVLGYDRPDIVLLDGERPILVVEETVEVPSGHNVGQRFARLAAAAEHHVPCLYFGPYVAKKHGGDTAGPRYMNLRLFGALDAMVRVTGTAVTTINWPVDSHYEVRRDADKDKDVRDYMATLLRLNSQVAPDRLNQELLSSHIQARMLKDRANFILTIRRQAQYDLPPDSVQVLTPDTFLKAYKFDVAAIGLKVSEIVLYQVGMTNIRSDPYTGMAMLYHYLYIAEHKDRALVLWFPNINSATWNVTARRGPGRKDIRLFRHAAEAILFSDKLVAKAAL